MYRTIVLALDGSEGSERALPVAEAYARRDGARIVVAHARTHALETALEAALHNRAEALSQTGIETTLDVRDSLEGEEAKAIAAGAHLGSTTQRLLPIAECPVVVVPGAYTGHGLATAESSAIEA